LHKGGGNLRNYRIIDFKRIKFPNCNIYILKKLYDPNRTAFIFLICYANGFLSYILACSNLNSKKRIQNLFLSFKDSIGNSYYLFQIPFKKYIYNVGFINNNKGKIARAAGTRCLLIKEFNKNMYILKMPSKKYKLISKFCIAILGQVSNKFFKLKKKTKAGMNRYLNKKPIVRGVAMNAIDHAHGGGRGKTSGKNKNRYGLLNKGIKTRKKNKKI
jgi:large subunit ribosomal protein L2